LVRELVSDVQVPGKNGYMGILPGHAPLLGLLGIGMLTYVSGGQKRYLSIHQGFLEVLEDHVRVLADVAERAEEIDVQRAKAALERAQEEGLNPALGVDPAAALLAMARAQARLEAAEQKSVA
jgi:F-type H+-transporting ATPase subunit epsilon